MATATLTSGETFTYTTLTILPPGSSPNNPGVPCASFSAAQVILNTGAVGACNAATAADNPHSKRFATAGTALVVPLNLVVAAA